MGVIRILQLRQVGNSPVSQPGQMVHIHGFQAARLVGTDIVPGGEAVHIRPQQQGDQGQGGEDHTLHVGECQPVQADADQHRADCKPDHYCLGQNAKPRQAVGADIQQHFCAGGADEKQRNRPKEQAQNSGSSRKLLPALHQTGAEEHQTQVDAAEPGHFKKAPPGIRCQGIVLRQDPQESPGEVGQLAEQVSKIDGAHRSQQDIHGDGI